MKRILSIFAVLISLVACAQNQTFTGVKTFASPPKFNNLVQNDLNNKVLTINTSNVLQWRNANSLSPVGYLGTGSVANADISVKIGDVNNEFSGTYYEYKPFLSGFPDANHNFHGNVNIEDGYFRMRGAGYAYYGTFYSANLTNHRFYTLPDTDGTFLVDAPADGQNYVRNNNTWQISSSGSTPTLDSVLTAGNIGTNQYVYLYNGVSFMDPSNQTFSNLSYDGTLSMKSLNSSPVTITSNPTDINTQYATYISPDGGAVAKMSNSSNYNFAPPSNTTSGYKGEIRVVGGYLYVCTSSNPSTGIGTWIRSAVETTW